jgi:hypothetical protein
MRSPETQTVARRSASGATRPLVGCGPANFFDEQRIDAAIGVIAENSSQTAVDHQAHAVDGKRRFRNISGDDYFTPVIARYRGVLLGRRQFTVQREYQKLRAQGIARGSHSARDFIGARHENEGIALRMGA